MPSFRAALLLTLSVLAASCGRDARINGRLDGAASGQVTVQLLDGAALKTVDSSDVSSTGRFACKVPLAKGQPEFAYVSYNGRQVASLILCEGDRIKVETDTLGTLISLSGSPESALLHEADSAYAAFSARAAQLEGAAFTREYVDLYRKSVAFVMRHAHSLSSVPVLLRKVTPELPVFAQSTDGLIFANVADSLSEVYPASRYVKQLRTEAARRKNVYEISQRLQQAGESAFPEIELPDTKAQTVKLSDVAGDKRLVMLYFWAFSNEEKMFNLDALKPLYDDFKGKGFEIFSVALDPDKSEWAATVKRQGLGWVNVCDTRGATSPYIGLYGISQLPMVYFIKDGQIDPDARVSDAASIRTYVSAALK